MIIPHQLTLKNVQEAFESIQQELKDLRGNVTNNTVNITSVTNSAANAPQFPLTDAVLRSVDSIYAIQPPGQNTDSRSVTILDVDDYVRHAIRYPGTNASDKISEAGDDLPASGGTIDATGLEGVQTWTSNPFDLVTKPITLIMGAGVTTIPIGMTIPNNVSVVMPAGAIFFLEDSVTFTLQLSPASSISEHFAVNEGSILQGKAILVGMSMIHSRWFDDGSHDERCIQRAIDAIGDDTPSSRGGTVVWVDDPLRLRDTVIINQKIMTLDCGGIPSFSATFPPPCGGFIWNGNADQPMLEIKNVLSGLVIQNTRFYGNVVNRPRSAISLVNDGTSGIGQGAITLRNIHIGMQFGDNDFAGNDYTAIDSLVDGIRIGDTYDSGTLGVNDHVQIIGARIWGCTNAGIRQGSAQNSLGTFQEINFFWMPYAFWIASQVSIYSSFGAVVFESMFYTPFADDFSQTVVPYIYAYDVQSEQSKRHLLMDGSCVFHQRGGGFSSSSSTAVDTSVILGQNNSVQAVYLTDFSFQDNAPLGAWKITLKASDVFHACTKILNYHGAGIPPTIDMDTANGLEARLASRSFLFFDGTALAARTNNEFPLAQNLLMGGSTDFSSFDASKYHIPTRGLRVGDTQNRAGAWEISVASATLTATSGTSVTASALIPAYSFVFGVTSRNIDAQGITGGTLQLGDATIVDKWNANLATTDHTATTMASWNPALSGSMPYYQSVDEDVVLRCSGGTFTDIEIDVTACFLRLLAPPGKF